MYPKWSIYLTCCLCVCVISIDQSTKWLIENPDFNSEDAWISGYLPCSLEEVVFPSDYGAVLPLPKEVDVSGFILPKDGAILLNQDAFINFGGDSKERSCENGESRKAYVKKPRTSKWFDPRSWRTTPAMTQNNALPHMERVPCNNDSIVIQRKGSLSIDLENVPYLRLGQLSLAGSVVDKNYLIKLIGSDIGQLLFRHSEAVTVEYYRNDVCGCHRDFSEFVDPICHNVVESCMRPHCLVPVTPFESCCAICGAVLRFEVDRCDDGKLYKLRKLISMAIWDQDLSNDLDYHVNYINSAEYGNFLQAIIVDQHDYSEKSVAFANRLNATTDWTKLFEGAHRLEVQFSGRPHNPSISFASVLLIILCMLLVSFVALVIFAHYAPDHRYLRHVPQWVYDPNRWRTFILRSPVVFTRFDNVTTGGDMRTAADMRENIIMGYDAETGQVRERAFDNPMFGSVPPEGASATEASVKEKSKASKRTNASVDSTLESVALVDDAEGDEVQELTEITLESSSDSEEQEETKE